MADYRIKKVKKISNNECHYWAQRSVLCFFWVDIDKKGYEDPEEALKICHEHQGKSKEVEVSYISPLRGIK